MLSAADHETFRRLTEGADSLVLITHAQADGDALGSELALQRYLRSTGKRCTILNNDPVDKTLAFMIPDGDDVRIWDDVDGAGAIASADLIILLDSATPHRVGRLEPHVVAAADRTLCIDHHPAEESPWAWTLADTSACATAVLVYELITDAGWQPDLAAAQALYVGIATDTGYFRFNCTDARTHRVVARLVDLGVQPAEVYEAVYEQNNLAYTRLLGHALTTMKVDADGRVATVALSRSDLQRLNAQGEDTSEITSHMLALNGVRAVALIRERPDGKIKVSLRSKGTIDVNSLAQRHGGGGHRNASGAVLDSTLAEVQQRIVDGLVELTQQPS
ncbi:MAG: bifunctional oligoribonuclease/PAP phosphatase NrnA [Acidobacteriota bacterium]|nr:bifunctional oligoribonuclease/PAP phosphatase NrnA [Acidobacteriota bacterium]MDH3786799.1 bifunctional oligoribonuclease/PAP phosphatase NrnA [Acidobacteriota bacterium]